MDAFTVSSAVTSTRLGATRLGARGLRATRLGALLLGTARAGQVPFTVTNTGHRDLTAHAHVFTEPGVEATWFHVEEPKRPAPADSTQQFTVKVSVPAGARGGSYRFRLDVVDEQDPDEYDGEGPWTTIEVPASRSWRLPFRLPWMAAAAALGVVLLAAVIALVVVVIRAQRPPELVLDTTVRDFGNVALGQGSPSSLVIVRNRGGASATVAPSFAGADPKDFSVVADTCSGQSLPAGSSCRIQVAFLPAAQGPREAVFLVTAVSASASAKTPLIIFTGTGQGTAAPITFSPASVVLDVPTLPSSVPATTPQANAAHTVLTVTNTGQRPFRVQSVQLRGVAPEFRVVSGCDGLVLSPGQSCKVAVLFASSSILPRDVTAELDVATDAGGVQVVPLSGYRGPYVLPNA